MSTVPLKYPTLATVPHTDTYHGVTVADPFRWLEDENSEQTKTFIGDQQTLFNAYSDSPAFTSLQPKLRAKMEAQYNYERVGLPGVRGGRAFFFRNTGLQNQDILYKADATSQPTQFSELSPTPLLDLNAEFPEGTTSLSTHSYNKSGTLLSYALSHGGSDWVTIKVRDVATGKDLPDTIPWVKFSGISWLGEEGFFYSRYPSPAGVSVGGDSTAATTKTQDAGTETQANHSAAVYYHRVGTAAVEDLLVYASPEQPQWRGGVGVTEDEKYLYLSISKGTDPVNRLYVARASTFTAWAKTTSPRPLAPLELPPTQATYKYMPFRALFDNFEAQWDIVASLDTRLFLQTNLHAPKGRIVVVQLPKDSAEGEWESDRGVLAGVAAGETLKDIDQPSTPTNPASFSEILPENPAEVLDWAAHVAGNKLVTCVLKDVVNILRVYTLGGEGDLSPLPPPQPLTLPNPGTVASFSGRPHLPRIYIKHVSFTSPGTSLSVDLGSSSSSSVSPPLAFAPFWSASIPGFDAENFVVKQEFVEASDGVKVPVFIVHAKTATLPAPTLLYAYGGFSINLQPSFSSLRLAFLQNCGGVFAMACIRGGGEYGEKEWHLAGSRLNKRTSFNDFGSVADHLAAKGYTTPSQLAIMGGSNGGLLTLAASLRGPQRYAAAVSQVPVADFLRFGLFTIGHAWRGEYGFVEDREDFFNLLSLSPYHQALAPPKGPLPAILVTTADHDDRVVPLHSFKAIAALQSTYASLPEQKNPILLRVESKAGHGAGKPTSKILDEYSQVWAFIAAQTKAVWRD